MRSMRVLMLVAGIAGCLVWHAMFWWSYFGLGEWLRENVP